MSKKILITLIVIILIGAGIYSAYKFISKERDTELILEGVGLLQIFQGKDYRIFAFDIEGEGRRIICEVITGRLNEEEVGKLSQKLTEDILLKNKKIREIMFFFYSDIIPAGIEDCDVAEVIWLEGEIKITMVAE